MHKLKQKQKFIRILHFNIIDQLIHNYLKAFSTYNLHTFSGVIIKSNTHNLISWLCINPSMIYL